MIAGYRIGVVIPAFNEENSVGKVVADIPTAVDIVVVVNNNSADNTRDSAQAAGAVVLDEPRQGYGWACMTGIHYLAALPVDAQPHIIVFMDADYSDFPEELPALVAPLVQGADLVIGSRVLGTREKGSMMPQQVAGNLLATTLIRWLYGYRFTDLGPFRAIWLPKLLSLHMQEMTYGWTVEMQVKAARMGWRCTEVPVRYRKRIGHSKVTGTIKGTVGAGYKILATIFTHIFAKKPA